MDDCLVFLNEPELEAPYILIGFNGWLNAGEVSTGSIDYLRRKLNAGKFARLDPQAFYIYQIPGAGPDQTLRPHARIEEGMVKKLVMPQNDFYFWKSGTGHDLILFSGLEPNLAWPEYAQAIFEMAKRYRAKRIYILGGVFDQVPHTRETRVYAVVSHMRIQREFRSFYPFLHYEGPCSFTTMLISSAAAQGVEAAGITARVPLYVQNYNAKACYDLLRNILDLTRLSIDLSDLKQSGDGLIEMTDMAFRQNKTAMEQLKRLEEMYDAALLGEVTPMSGDDYDRNMEEMLKMKKEGRKLH